MVPEVNAAGPRRHPQGHRGQPQLHDHGGDAGAGAAAPRGRAARSWWSSTYQAVSGAGLAGVRRARGAAGQDRRRGRRADLRRRRASSSPPPPSSRRPSPTTCCPMAGPLVDDGSGETDEEQKLRNESRKILGIPDLAGVRHVRAGAGVHRPLACRSTREFDRALTARAGPPGPGRRLRVCELADVPTPLAAAGTDPTARSGRLRVDPTVPNGLALFVSGDNLRKGAALNAVQIAEALLGRAGSPGLLSRGPDASARARGAGAPGERPRCGGPGSRRGPRSARRSGPPGPPRWPPGGAWSRSRSRR